MLVLVLQFLHYFLKSFGENAEKYKFLLQYLLDPYKFYF